MRRAPKSLVGTAAIFFVAAALLAAVEGCERRQKTATVQIPPFTANKLLILAKLRNRDFATLDSEFEQYQRAFEKNPASELNEKLAFDSFATDDSSTGDRIAEWIKQRPDSFAAHMAMGSYYSWRGWRTRGAAVASMTPSERLEGMHRFFADSEHDLKAALTLEPHLGIAYAALIGEARGEADRNLLGNLRAEALRRVPASFVVREQVMESLYPRWGGDHHLMADFAERSQALAKENPSMHWLLGFVDSDEGETLGLHGEYDPSIAALTRAIQKGGEFSGFYFIRGVGYAYKKSYAEALQDLNRANELSPQDPELLIRRAYVLAELGRASQALADVNFVKTFETPDDLWTELHDWAAKASAKEQP